MNKAKRRINPLITITFGLFEQNFRYLEGLTYTDMLKDVLCLYRPVKRVGFKRIREGSRYRVDLTIYGVDKTALDSSLNAYSRQAGFNWDKATLEEKYGLLVSDLAFTSAGAEVAPGTQAVTQNSEHSSDMGLFGDCIASPLTMPGQNCIFCGSPGGLICGDLLLSLYIDTLSLRVSYYLSFSISDRSFI